MIEAAGQSGSIEIFVNFMIMDINRNALRRNPSKSVSSKVEQMTRLWGDDSPKPMAMKTKNNAVIYYLNIVNDIFKKYGHR